MSNKNNIFDDNYRINFLRTANIKSLNEYLKNMEKLSKKGGKYYIIYKKDIDYLLNKIINNYQDGGNIFDFFNYNDDMKYENNKIMSDKPVCDTETYVKKINNITSNSFCTITTQQTNKCDNRCIHRLNELDIIKKVLNNYKNYNVNNNDWIKALRKFIDIVLCCESAFSKLDNEKFRTIYFKYRRDKISIRSFRRRKK